MTISRSSKWNAVISFATSFPGQEGETEPGKRRINRVWYWNVPEAELSKLMTGVDGREWDFSVPPGQVCEEWLKNRIDQISHPAVPSRPQQSTDPAMSWNGSADLIVW